jgi:hypothetical protein
MKHSGKMAICLAGGLVLQTGARAVIADSPGNPYSGIVDRNVFALKPKPLPPIVDTTPPVSPQKIVLQGIVNAWGKKQVFWKTMMPAKAGEAAKEKSFMDSEGEREGEIEILEINELACTVKVMNNGKPQSLNLKDDGMKPAGGPGAVPGAPPVMPGIPGVPGVPGVPMNTGISGPAGAFGGGGAATVQRPLRVAPTTASGYSTAAGVAAQGQNKPMSYEEQVVFLEVQRKLTEKDVEAGKMPPLP